MSSPLAEAFLLVTLNNCYETPQTQHPPKMKGDCNMVCLYLGKEREEMRIIIIS